MKRRYFNLDHSVIDYPYKTNNDDGFVKSVCFDDRFILTFNCQNVSAKEMKVNIIGNQVRIKIIRKDKNKGHLISKSSYKIYKLPDNVDSRSIKYTFNDHGDLIITGEKES
uniref:SHSP domain-containing protein n=1 Tax=Strongyloides papillosus TaxID=174720 RepID=A0A0N5BWP2_STREA